MASNGAAYTETSALIFGQDPTGGSWPVGDVARLQLVRLGVGDSKADMAWAGAAMARVEQEIDHLWRDSMQADDRAMSPRLAEVSHTLRRAAARGCWSKTTAQSARRRPRSRRAISSRSPARRTVGPVSVLGEDVAQPGCEGVRLAGLAVLAAEEAAVVAGEHHRARCRAARRRPRRRGGRARRRSRRRRPSRCASRRRAARRRRGGSA